jgi:hypothetical protein
MNLTVIVPKTHDRNLCPVMPCGLTHAEWVHRLNILSRDLRDLADDRLYGKVVSVRSCTIAGQAAWLYGVEVPASATPTLARLDTYLKDQFHLTMPMAATLGSRPIG